MVHLDEHKRQARAADEGARTGARTDEGRVEERAPRMRHEERDATDGGQQLDVRPRLGGRGEERARVVACGLDAGLADRREHSVQPAAHPGHISGHWRPRGRG